MCPKYLISHSGSGVILYPGSLNMIANLLNISPTKAKLLLDTNDETNGWKIIYSNFKLPSKNHVSSMFFSYLPKTADCSELSIRCKL